MLRAGIQRNGGKPGELKHLITRRKRKQIEIPRVVASEMGIAQTICLGKIGVVGLTIKHNMKWNSFGKQTERVKVPRRKEYIFQQYPE